MTAPTIADLQQELADLRRQQAGFIRAAAHELRTPLQSLQGFAELLEGGLPPARLRRFLAIIRRDTLRLAAVVDDLSLRSELDNGTLRLEPAACAIEPLLLELAGEVETQYPNRVVALEYPAAAPPVWADPERLRQILRMLLANAARCAGRGERTVTLSAQTHAAGGIVFRVGDDGPGIPPAMREAVFEPVAPRPSGPGAGLRRPRFGLGLGLYGARALARRMGGDLWIEDGAGPVQRGRKGLGHVCAVRMPCLKESVE